MNPADEIANLLAADGAELGRWDKHKVYRLSNGKLFTMAATPSDHRACLNAVSDLRLALGVRRVIYKNPDRRPKSKRPICRPAEVFEPVDMKPGWRQQLAAVDWRSSSGVSSQDR
jgi:hypothetical protein